MAPFVDSIVQLLSAALGVLVSLGELLLPWVPLFAWVAFWLFAINWNNLREVLLRGGWIAVVLTGLIAVLIWGTIAPPADGNHYVLGLTLKNFVGKTMYVTALICIMLLCGSVQLSGALGRNGRRTAESAKDDPSEGDFAQHGR